MKPAGELNRRARVGLEWVLFRWLRGGKEAGRCRSCGRARSGAAVWIRGRATEGGKGGGAEEGNGFGGGGGGPVGRPAGTAELA